MLKFSLLDLLFVIFGLSNVSNLACTPSFLLAASSNEDRLCRGDLDARALNEGTRSPGELMSLFLSLGDPSDFPMLVGLLPLSRGVDEVIGSVLALRLLLPIAA